jgi:hypothetical protein
MAFLGFTPMAIDIAGNSVHPPALPEILFTRRPRYEAVGVPWTFHQDERFEQNVG